MDDIQIIQMIKQEHKKLLDKSNDEKEEQAKHESELDQIYLEEMQNIGIVVRL